MAGAALALLLLAAACTSGDGDESRSADTARTMPPAGEFAGEMRLAVDHPDRCDPLDPAHCLLPFPSDTFTTDDPDTDTGRRVALVRESMPVNKDGMHIDPTEWNRNDGFSPGQPISVFVPQLDLERSEIATLVDLPDSLADDARIVLLDADTGERHPYWAELDASVESGDARVLYIRPAVNFPEGHRMIVALRHLKNARGEQIAPANAFVAYRDRLETDVPEVEARRERYERLFTELQEAGVARGDLYLAWDFTVASERNLTERMLHIRDDAFERLGGDAPAFTVATVEDDPDEYVARRVSGTFEVPNYLTGTGEPGSRFNAGDDGLPEVNGTFSAPFTCIVPPSALDEPARPGIYGHGLLGSHEQVSSSGVRAMAGEHNFVFCATKWAGMSDDDIPNAIEILNDVSNMPTLADRGQQGILNTLFLGRLMIHDDGLVSHPAFQDAQGDPVIDTDELFFDGNSQGGIMGGAATAVSLDWTRAVLGVTGMNYSTLLQRSVDWDTYQAVYEPAYPNEIERGIGLSLIQMLWDRAETNGYAHHLTDDPLPGTPEHEVLLHVAIGDFQVSTYTAEVEARTIGARIHWPATTSDRLPDREPHWGIPRIESYPYDGSAIVFWDSGTPAPPTVNLPPREGRDPHSDPRSDPGARRQKSEFLSTDGAVVDVCDAQPCTAEPSD